MILSWIGLLMGLVGVILGQVLEGGHLTQLVVPTAAMIVFGGTLGATLLSSTMPEFIGALKGIQKIYLGGTPNYAKLVTELSEIAAVARREGILALERKVGEIKDPFFANNLRHIIDGYDPKVAAEIMETRISMEEEEKTAIAKVWETAGGFSPTVGIIGAVLGLIHVMSNLSDSSKLGSGIAVAFVATVYGVGAANLVFIPMGSKLKKIGKHEVLGMKLIYTGLVGIQNGLNPRVIEDQLNAYLGEHGSSEEKGGAKKAA